MEINRKKELNISTNKRNIVLKDENTNKKIKLNLNKLNKTNNNCKSNLPSPPKECICTMNEYDDISKENEEVAQLLEFIFKNINKNKNMCITDEIEKKLKNNIKFVVNSLYEKIEYIKKTKVIESTDKSYYIKHNIKESITVEEYLDFLDLNGDERKLLMFFKFLARNPLISENINDKLKKEMDMDTMSKLTECLFCHPRIVYYMEVSDMDVESYEDCSEYFNYESLYKLNITLYSSLRIINDKDFYFNTLEEFLELLKEMIESFILYGNDKKNQDLFNRFVELQNKFPKPEKFYEY